MMMIRDMMHMRLSSKNIQKTISTQTSAEKEQYAASLQKQYSSHEKKKTVFNLVDHIQINAVVWNVLRSNTKMAKFIYKKPKCKNLLG